MPRGALVNTLIGDYRLDHFVGAGGMGEVYRATHTRLGRAAAVKVLSPEGPGAAFVERFWNEARLHASLHHPNIVELYDFIDHRGQLCIVMEFVEGETLSDCLRRRGPLPPGDALAVFRGVARAVAYLHEHGIVHRDIKSANVRLATGGEAKLLDFGIAKGGSTPALTHAGAVIGTLVYLAPEQLRGAPATARSDVWALGLLLYETLTGRLPFEGDTAGALLETITRASFVPASVVARAAGGAGESAWKACDRTIARCLRRDPGDRFEDAAGLLRAIPPSADHVESEPAGRRLAAAAAAARLAPQALAWLERYWAWLTGAAAVVVLLAIVVAWPRPPSAPAGSPEATRSGERPAAEPRPSVPRVAPTDPAAGTTTHRIVVVGGTADVFVNGEFKGRTPFEYRATRQETITLELRQEGFVPIRDTFDVTTRPVWTFVLHRAGGRHP